MLADAIAAHKATITAVGERTRALVRREREHIVVLERFAAMQTQKSTGELKEYEKRHAAAVEREKTPQQREGEACGDVLCLAFEKFSETLERPDEWECERCLEKSRESARENAREQRQDTSDHGYGCRCRYCQCVRLCSYVVIMLAPSDVYSSACTPLCAEVMGENTRMMRTTTTKTRSTTMTVIVG